MDEVSDYERAHPQKVTGVNLGIMLGPIPAKLGNTLPARRLGYGVPRRCSQRIRFGMAPFVPAPDQRRRRLTRARSSQRFVRSFSDPNPRANRYSEPGTNTPGLSEIATVVAHNRDYDITLLGTDTIDGHDCYHLALKPERDPGKLRLRQAWIDEQTYATWQLVNAVKLPIRGQALPSKMPWTIHFADVDGAHYVREGRDRRG